MVLLLFAVIGFLIGYRLEMSRMKLTIPELALVVMIGPSGSGKSSFARKHFKPTEVLSSDK